VRAGGDTLFPEELELLGDLVGKDLVHLQCNSGPDTLCLARRGARCVGVDISDEAVRTARGLSEGSGIPAEFVRDDVYAWLGAAPEASFDLVFASYGALVWLSDLRGWARGIARILRPGGRLVVMEFHPAGTMLSDDLRPGWPYSTAGRPIRTEGIGDYVAESGEGLTHGAAYDPGIRDFANPEPAYEFAWGLGEVVTAVAEAGLRVEVLREWPYSNGCSLWAGMRREGRRFLPPEGVPEIPLMYGLTARRS
jgi:SAM-dependent methyltransferase